MQREKEYGPNTFKVEHGAALGVGVERMNCMIANTALRRCGDVVVSARALTSVVHGVDRQSRSCAVAAARSDRRTSVGAAE